MNERGIKEINKGNFTEETEEISTVPAFPSKLYNSIKISLGKIQKKVLNNKSMKFIYLSPSNFNITVNKRIY